MNKYLSWVEIRKDSLTHNIKEFKKITNALVAPCVKSNAYGHGLVEASKIFVSAGADWLTVNSIDEAEELRKNDIEVPIYVMGYTLQKDLKRAWKLDVRLVVYGKETIDALASIADDFKYPIKLHIKIETGNNRQGIRIEEVLDFAKYILEKGKNKLVIEGLATHFANIEDTTSHDYAFKQLENFMEAKKILDDNNIDVPMMHCANSAATILFSETHLDMCRIGISSYGMWPSKETFVSYNAFHKQDFLLKPAFTWKSIVGQIKEVPKNEFIGYGCSFRATRNMRIAIIPVGYYDGYDRKLSNNAHVLIHGQRAKLIGRVCMNMIMVDITDIADVVVEDEVVLIGDQAFTDKSSYEFFDNISPEEFASWIGSINYEVTTRVNDRISRIFV